MKQFDWGITFFVGISLVHEYWIFWGLPKVYYWEVKNKGGSARLATYKLRPAMQGGRRCRASRRT